MKRKFLVRHLSVLSILFIGCSTTQTIYKEQNPKKNSVKIIKGYFSGFLYFQLTESKNNNLLSRYTIEIADNGTGSISIRRNSFSNQGKYSQSFHAVSDTAGVPVLWGKSYSKLLDVDRSGFSFEPISQDDITNLRLVVNEIGKQNNQSKLPDEKIKQLIGWILIK